MLLGSQTRGKLSHVPEFELGVCFCRCTVLCFGSVVHLGFALMLLVVGSQYMITTEDKRSVCICVI